MNRKRAVLSLVLIVLLGGQWLVPVHVFTIGIAHSLPAHASHSGHSTHGHSQTTSVLPLHHSCCDDGTPGTHENLCCGACPALPGAIADFRSYTPHLSLPIIEPQEKSFIFLASLWHPPTL